jgi:hypothetical protein
MTRNVACDVAEADTKATGLGPAPHSISNREFAFVYFWPCLLSNTSHIPTPNTMSAPTRPGLTVKRSTMRPPGSTMRPPPPSRAPSRAQTATPSQSARPSEIPPPQSPAQSVQGGKRKEREFDHQDQDHETNINVVVRCRGRNDRELRENSGVVVSTEGVKGRKVELSMGPSALSNKTYQFDKVFSPAADQAMMFDDVVEPILDEVRRLDDDSPKTVPQTD